MNATKASTRARLRFWLKMVLFDPIELVNKYRALPQFIRNWRSYSSANRTERFAIRWRDLWYRSQDRYGSAGAARGHYFFQDLWAARQVREQGVTSHVDVGSRMDGFVAHLLTFCAVTYVDIRSCDLVWPGFTFVAGSITNLPFADSSVQSLSCLHVIEHVGLGRYGDDVDPAGYLVAAKELQRVLAPGGRLLVGTPVGRERVCFDAHRVFDPETIVGAFPELTMASFALIDDSGMGIDQRATFDQARHCNYGCGLFVFIKQGADRE